MRLLLIVGQPASGKTTFAKNNILNNLKNYYVYDVYNYEYKNLEEVHPLKYTGGRAKYTGEDEQLVLNSLQNFRNTAFVMEDATIFLDNHKKSKEFKKVVYGRRHTNLLIVLIFHAMNRIPKWLFEQTNTLVLFKTQDFENDIINKFKNNILQKSFKELQVSRDPHASKIIKLF